jgi:hypothetical protein
MSALANPEIQKHEMAAGVCNFKRATNDGLGYAAQPHKITPPGHSINHCLPASICFCLPKSNVPHIFYHRKCAFRKSPLHDIRNGRELPNGACFMYLLRLDDTGFISLVRCDDNDIPPYAILSHTWGSDGEELTFHELALVAVMYTAHISANGKTELKMIKEEAARDPMRDEVLYSIRQREGYRKIQFCGEQAAKDGIHFFWVDSCCINKTSSAELTEAINSMFRWYKCAEKCYVYLTDVSIGAADEAIAADDRGELPWLHAFKSSRWFTRGWTLQELLAPIHVEFFSKEGQCLGTREEFREVLSEITSIPPNALQGARLAQFDVEERFSWAERRQTTRSEDKAYALLGIFGVFMPLIYGEGVDNAMKRLKRNIRQTEERAETDLLESLRFEQIYARQTTITVAHKDTCQWLLSKAEYLDWLNETQTDRHQGLLWIKGKPGTGKSTIMKYAHDQARKKAELTPGLSNAASTSMRSSPGPRPLASRPTSQLPSQARTGLNEDVVIAFFFNARGATLEKSTLGMYRSLLVQLLERHSYRRKVLAQLPFPVAELHQNYQWNIGILQELLKEAILSIKSPILCFIDALDECEEHEVREMISFLSQVGELATLANLKFQVCFASRHYPHITIDRGIELILEGQDGHTQDIVAYLESELKIGNNYTAQRIRSEVQRKASGIFMWVVLVVGILNKAYDSGRIHALWNQLHDIPSDLDELFRNILTRDPHNKDEFILCIEWVLFARYPLSPHELYFAILAGTEPDTPSEWDQDEISYDTIKRFILNASKGLTQVTVSDEPKVQFIHESVKDFLLKSRGIRHIWSDVEIDFENQSQKHLARCCSRYLTWGMLWYSEDLLNFEGIDPEVQCAFAILRFYRYPFLEYAVRNLSYHTTAAGEHNAIDLVVSKDGDSPAIQCTTFDELPELPTYQQEEATSMIYLLAEFENADLLCFACARTGTYESVRILIRGANPAHDSTVAVGAFGPDLRWNKKRHALSYLARFGNKSVFASVLKTRFFDVNTHDPDGATPLSMAVDSENKAIVNQLLAAGVDIDGVYNDFGNLLQVASVEGSIRRVQLLLQCGADVNAHGRYYGQALQAAAAKGHLSVVRLLLERGADVNAKGGKYGTALKAALLAGHANVVKVLQDHGARRTYHNPWEDYYGTRLPVVLKSDIPELESKLRPQNA